LPDVGTTKVASSLGIGASVKSGNTSEVFKSLEFAIAQRYQPSEKSRTRITTDTEETRKLWQLVIKDDLPEAFAVSVTPHFVAVMA
ncbi:hypothetical protein BaRGS_00014857, partial [Batillaria attramentaria]